MLIAYIHGFLSGPNAEKATIMKRYVKEHCPDDTFEAADFPDTPKEAAMALDSFVRARLDKELFLIGSSMGGFFCTLLQSRFGVRCALINPCVHPQEYFDSLVGPQHNDFTDRDFVLEPHMIEDLKALDKETSHFIPSQTIVYLQTGDEVLDYTRSQAFYRGALINVKQGGCHRYENFESICPEIISFAKREL